MERPAFVARKRELARLDGFLDRVLTGQGQTCFVAGEAGSGKTALVTEFARRVQDRHSELVVAIGQSDAHTGSGDPFLPFREVLGQLTGDVEAKLAQGSITEENAGRLRRLLGLSGQALVAVGPDLIGIFVPGAGLATRVGAFVAEKVGWLDKLEELTKRPREGEVLGSTGIEQSHILEQYTNVLKTLAAEQPLLVVLDDLQWADAASIGLLFRLGRRIGESRVLLVGTYRPEEVALGREGERHPLEKVLAEFKRYFGDIWVDLDQTGEAERQRFVDAFLDTEPNRLGESFRQALYDHTDGHPLFTIELLRDMQERGDLVRDEGGHWMEGPILDWQDLPDRVEGVIEERIGRLEEKLQEALTVGSVEGEDFTAEVVARVQESDARGLIHQLSGEVEKQHRLVRARGIQRLDPGGQRLSLYRFQHNLFQTYLYNDLDAVERVVLHEDVGTVLETLYGDRADEIAVQLARHFVEASVAQKAAHYLRRAGEQAAARFANQEAVAYFSRSLDLASKDDLVGRYLILLAREKVYGMQGEREAQSQDLAVLREVADALDDDRRRAEVALRQAHYAEATGEYPAAIEAAQSAIGLAQSAQDVSVEAKSYLEWGVALWNQGDYEMARKQTEQALSLAGGAQLREVEASCLHSLGVISCRQGDYPTASAYEKQALDIFREIGDRGGECGPLNTLGGIYAQQGDYAEARTYCEQALCVYREIGSRRGESILLSNLGQLSLAVGDYATARTYLTRALSIYRDIDDPRGRCHTLAHLGLLSHHLGNDEAARDSSQQALSLAQRIGDQFAEGIACARLGNALAGLGDFPGAESAYRGAVDLWRELDLPHLAADGLAGLARVALGQGNTGQAQLHAEAILSHLEGNTLDGADEPMRVHLTCYRILRASDAPRAQDILDSTYHLLQEQAAKISDEELRHSFLENVAAHREVIREFVESQQSKRQGE
jgi:adenylate cyclase